METKEVVGFGALALFVVALFYGVFSNDANVLVVMVLVLALLGIAVALSKSKYFKQ